jgi:hypothetical protein
VLWQALDIDDQFVQAWAHLGHAGGGVVRGKPYSQVECYQKVLRIGWHGECRGSQRNVPRGPRGARLGLGSRLKMRAQYRVNRDRGEVRVASRGLGICSGTDRNRGIWAMPRARCVPHKHGCRCQAQRATHNLR